MVQLSRASKRFGHKLLFEGVDWLVTPDDRIGLVGANGTGKSTLLRILCGSETLDGGERTAMRGLTAGYLRQDGLTVSGRSVFAECLSVFAEVRALEEELEQLAHRMPELDPAGAEYHEVAERFQRVDSEFRMRDGYAIEAQVGAVLTGLGFRKEDWARRTEEFSGGWQMRIALAKLLLEKPNLLLLDEPTNHLDLETRNWLEDYLRSYPFGYILISHDRYFLDVTIDRTVEIWNKRLTIYQGNYTKYLSQKDERRAQLQAAYRNQREQIEHLEAFISRFRYQATKAKQVQSRIKELEKIERIEIPEEEPVIHFKFPQPAPSGRMVAQAEGLAKSYGAKQVFSRAGFTIERGHRVALVGVNGAGKSTLIKLLTGDEAPTSGSVRLGHNVVCEYFAQDQYKALNGDARMLDDISRAAVRVPELALRSLLGCFLFSGDDVFKPLGVLSGGERNRYALARILVSPSNFLLLDEPTNHLDMRAKDVLLEALAAFSGTVIFVSHDRYFIDRLATRVLEVEGGTVTSHEGNYEDYLRRKEALATGPGSSVGLADAGSGSASRLAATSALPRIGSALYQGTTSVVPNDGQKEDGALAPGGQQTTNNRPRRLNPIRQKQMEERCAFLEEETPRIEAAIAHTEEQLGVYVSAVETQRLSELAEDLRSQLTALTAEWEELMLQLEGA